MTEDVRKRGDRIIELGPGAGSHGGRMLFEGLRRARHANASPDCAGWARTDVKRSARKPNRVADSAGRTREQPREREREDPAGRRVRDHRAERTGKSTLAEDILFRADRTSARRYARGSPGAVRRARWNRRHRDSRARGPVASRTNRARKRSDLHEGLGPRSRSGSRRSLLRSARGLGAVGFSFNVADAGRCEDVLR